MGWAKLWGILGRLTTLLPTTRTGSPRELRYRDSFPQHNRQPDQIFVFIRNVGFININIVAFYVNGTSLTPVSGPSHGWCAFSGNSYNLGVGSVCDFSLNWPNSACLPNYCPWVTGNILYIVAATARGNQVAYTVRAP